MTTGMRALRALEQSWAEAFAELVFDFLAIGQFCKIAFHEDEVSCFAFERIVLLVYGRFIMVSKRTVAESQRPFKPTRQQLIEAAGKTVPDVIAPDLRVLFCGINPGLYTAAVGHHFARPGNRFWPALHASGFTVRLLSPFEEQELLDLGCGITNVVARATAAASDLSKADFIEGGHKLVAKVARYRPRIVAILGVGAYRQAFGQPKATIGEQRGRIHSARVWVLPNPSGLNANYQLPDLVRLFVELRRVAGR
jgi:double-stranded uracil-DNA glycosylase